MMVKRFNPKKKEEVVQKKLTPTPVKEVKKIKQAKKEKVDYSYRGIHGDSEPEYWCLVWLFELEERGYIVKGSIDRANPYLLFNTVTRNYIEALKTKNVTKMEILYDSCQYTPDFKFTLTPKGLQFKLFRDINCNTRLKEREKAFLIHQDGKGVIEVKGSRIRNKNSTEEKWSVQKKWAWEKYGEYVNLWTQDIFFAYCFTPKSFMLTPIRKQLRKLKWKVHTIEEYIKREK